MKYSLRLYEQNFDNVPQAVIFLDAELKVLFVNKICKIILQKSINPIKGQYLYNFMKSKEDLKAIVENKAYQPTLMLLMDCHFQNIPTPYNIYINPMFDEKGQFLFYYSSCRPNTNDEEKTDESGIYYQIFDKMNMGIVQGENLIIKNVNPAFSRLTGLNKDAVIGKSAMKLAVKLGRQIDLKKANRLIYNFLIRKKNEKELLPFKDKILEITTNDDLDTTILRDVTTEQKLLSKMEGLHYVAHELAKDLSHDAYFDIVLKASRRLLNFSIASILLFRNDHLIIYKTTQEVDYLGKKLKLKEGIYGKTYRKQRTFLVNDYKYDQDAKPTDKTFKATLSVPIDKYGVFQAHSQQANVFSENDRKMAELLISHLVQALKRQEINKRVVQTDKSYRTLFENTPVSTVKIDMEGKMLLANQRFLNHFDCGKNYATKSILDFVSPCDRDMFTKKITKIIEEKILQSVVVENEMISGNDNIKNVICYMRLIPENSEILISMADITQLKLYENELNASLSEKEILLKEIHHRVKNNLQLVSSFIRIYIKSLDQLDKNEIIHEINSKIHTIVIVHERLYKSDSYKDISIGNYIKKLIPELLSTYRTREIILDYDMDEIFIDLNRSIPLGLIISEVITNSIKYAFPEDFKGKPTIGLKLKREGQFYIIRIYDNGIGMTSEKKSFGHELVAILTKQLNSTSKFTSKKGVEFSMKIPVNY